VVVPATELRVGSGPPACVCCEEGGGGGPVAAALSSGPIPPAGGSTCGLGPPKANIFVTSPPTSNAMEANADAYFTAQSYSYTLVTPLQTSSPKRF